MAMSSTMRPKVILPVLTRLVITRPSAVSRPVMPNGASSNSRDFSQSECGAWSVAIVSTVPSMTPAMSASASAAVRSGGFTLKQVL
ncbi:Uncharacterised protein [Collinsella intestinalis]|nr:Uncharacterised protein [Collinsella intestinalis]